MANNTNHREIEIGGNHSSEPLSDKLRKRAHARSYSAGGKLVFGDPMDSENLQNRAIYSLPDFDREMGSEVSTRLRRYAPTLHDPYTGEYATMRTPTFTRAGANRKAARAVEHYVKEGYVE